MPRSPGNVAAARIGAREVAAIAPIAVAIGGGSERARGNGREGREGGVMGAVTDTGVACSLPALGVSDEAVWRFASLER